MHLCSIRKINHKLVSLPFLCQSRILHIHFFSFLRQSFLKLQINPLFFQEYAISSKLVSWLPSWWFLQTETTTKIWAASLLCNLTLAIPELPERKKLEICRIFCDLTCAFHWLGWFKCQEKTIGFLGTVSSIIYLHQVRSSI